MTCEKNGETGEGQRWNWRANSGSNVCSSYLHIELRRTRGSPPARFRSSRGKTSTCTTYATMPIRCKRVLAKTCASSLWWPILFLRSCNLGLPQCHTRFWIKKFCNPTKHLLRNPYLQRGTEATRRMATVVETQQVLEKRKERQQNGTEYVHLSCICAQQVAVAILFKQNAKNHLKNELEIFYTRSLLGRMGLISLIDL